MIYFTGYICLCDKAFDISIGVGSQIVKGKLKPFARLQKHNCDEWVGNFEGVVSDVTCRNNYTKNSFRISSIVFDKCDSIIDYWGIANNHVMEHGSEAYEQMEHILSEKSKGVFESNKHRTECFENKSKKIALTGFSMRVEEEKHKPLYRHLPETKEIQEECCQHEDADYRVAYIHWGVEYVDYPSIEQVKFAHWLVDVGYDLVIGMHPHVLQGYEVYNGKYIFYSLGNTVFNMNHGQCRYGAIVSLDPVKGSVGYKYIHINDDFCPEYIDENDVPECIRFTTLNKKVGTEQNVEKYISCFQRGLKAYRKSNNHEIAKIFFKFKPKIFIQIFWGFIKRRLK